MDIFDIPVFMPFYGFFKKAFKHGKVGFDWIVFVFSDIWVAVKLNLYDREEKGKRFYQKDMMRMKSTNRFLKTSLLILAMGFFTYSCQSAVMLYFGIKNPEKPVSKEERLAYYEPFINNQETPLKLYALPDTTKWRKTFQNFEGYSFPLIYLKNQRTDSLYSLSCFEDIEWEIDLINDNNLQYSDFGQEEKFAYINDFVADSSKLIYNSKNKTSTQPGEWQVQMLSATFLGKKLRKRMLPILKLKGLESITILDVSKVQ